MSGKRKSHTLRAKARDKREHRRRIEVALAQVTQTLDDLEIPIPTVVEQVAIQAALLRLPLEVTRNLHTQALRIGEMLSRTQGSAIDLTGQLYYLAGDVGEERKARKPALEGPKIHPLGIKLSDTELLPLSQLRGTELTLWEQLRRLWQAARGAARARADQDLSYDPEGPYEARTLDQEGGEDGQKDDNLDA